MCTCQTEAEHELWRWHRSAITFCQYERGEKIKARPLCRYSKCSQLFIFKTEKQKGLGAAEKIE